MIDFSGERSFFRFWLPLLLLGGLVVFLFPKFGPREERTAREAWDGMVVLVSLPEVPTEPLRLLATMPLRTTGAVEELWVIGDTAIPAGTRSAPLLLGTPAGTELSRRLSRRVIRDRSQLYSATPTVILYRAEDIGASRASLLGAIVRTTSATGDPGVLPSMELIDASGRKPLPAPLFEKRETVTLEPSRDRRWIGNPKSFSADWAHFKELNPGGLTPFIHARWTLPPLSRPTSPPTPPAAPAADGG